MTAFGGQEFDAPKTWSKARMRKALKIVLLCFSFFFIILVLWFLNRNKETKTHYAVILPKFSSRSFHLGFTRWPPDFTQKSVDDMYVFMGRHADLVANHFDNGVPWPEAFSNQPYSTNIMNDWQASRKNTSDGMKIYVAITPMDSSRQRLAKYRGSSDNMPLPAPWDTYELNSPQVKQAYLNYARRVVEFLKPDYFAVGIEVNIAIQNPKVWNAYKELHQYIYIELKKSYPKLQVFTTISLNTLKGLNGKPNLEKQQSEVKSILPYEDIMALSAYPYGFGGREEKPVPSDFFDAALKFGKPLAVAETGCPSKNFRALLFAYKFNQDDQNQCISTLLKSAQDNEFAFFVNWSTIDFDKLVDKFSGFNKSFARLFEYTGLETSDGKPKPALSIWDSYLKIPYRTTKKSSQNQ